jgi:energy-coupling factor transporter transmembrane protein EcfT
MSTAHVVVTILAAVGVGCSAVALFLRVEWIAQQFTDYGIRRSWWPWLATAKAAGATGLVVGLFVPVIGAIAGIALVVYFAGAIVTVVRARWLSHIPYPALFLALVAAATGLGFAA